MTQDRTDATRHPKELTGRIVLFCFLGFFGIVAAMNAVLLRAATTTFGGVDTSSAYKMGLAFNTEIAAARAQQTLHWLVDAKVTRSPQGDASLSVNVRDSRGASPPAIALVAKLAHPADTRRDQIVAMRQIAPGVFDGAVRAEPGQWDMVIDISRGGERLFRSRSRVTLR
jgi:nitrogen fixation protein FixH